VTTAFISDHGNACAQRYTDHQIVESYKGALEYEDIHAKLGYDPITSKDMNKIRKQYDNVIKKYGKVYGAQYGWAAKDLNGKQPTFKEIEKAARIDYLRGHYRMASHGIHANPKGIFFSMTSLFPTDMLLAGPSNAGLADAGHSTALSLTTISATLALLASNFDHQVALRSMNLLTEEIGTTFLRAHKKLYRDEIRFRVAESDFEAVGGLEGESKEDNTDVSKQE
jgi:hypothetical protein